MEGLLSAVIALSDACRSYRAKLGATPVLRGANLEIGVGEFALILGAPGCGKSTLHSILACLRQLDSGSYLLFGNDTARLEERARVSLRSSRVGMVFQSPALLTHMTAHYNVALPLLYAGVPSALCVARTASALRAVQMDAFKSCRCDELSMSQRQCIAIARALVHDPALILADEPLSLLEPASTNAVLKLLLAQRHLGRALVVFSCDPLLADFADRIYLLKDGALTVHPLQFAKEQEPEQEQEQDPDEEEDIYRPLVEAEEESRTIFDDPNEDSPETEATDLPVNIALDEALQTDFVKEEWWRR
ncbi:MAG: ATP-binding cassette domain-containing protein [Coriobacteriales bacterium]|jgi:putative ABC transport system ATP-binding protein|nr:ATP-binding cassette domain-containing protein [Coriobacteriales bacterium]